MINVYIFSQKQFNKVMSVMGWNDETIDSIDDSAIVSICNTDGSMTHWFNHSRNNVLNINFDDTAQNDPAIGIYSISDQQAKEIVDFFENNIHIKNFIVHCVTGISRSAAVAECFADFLRSHGVKDVMLHKNFSFQPNPQVELLLHKELSKRN